MIFHLVLNSLFVFLILSTLVELFLFVFKIKNARLRTICRFFPILKLPFDLLVFGLYGESLFLNFNPLSCELFLQDLIAKLLPMGPVGNLNTSAPTIIPQYIAEQIPRFYFNLLTAGISVISIAMICRKIFHLINSRIYLKRVVHAASLCDRPVTNALLKKNLEGKKALILTSENAQVPFAADRRTIVFPKELLGQLSQEEFEAIAAHELEHLRWKDPILKLVGSIICSLFWWIPTAWWIKRLEADQERASDLGIHKYGMDALALASAFIKTASNAKFVNLKMAAICSFTTKTNHYTSRLENILNSHQIACGNLVPLKFAMGIGLCLLSFFSFWIC